MKDSRLRRKKLVTKDGKVYLKVGRKYHEVHQILPAEQKEPEYKIKLSISKEDIEKLDL